MNVERKTKGNIVISLTAIVFLSLLGVGVLLHCITHIRTVKARNTKMKQTHILDQDMIYYLHCFRERIFKENLRVFNEPGIEFFNDAFFPVHTTANGNVITVSFTHVEFPKPGYKKTRVFAALAASAVSNRHPYHLAAEATIDILAGKIPLGFFPLFLRKETGVSPEKFLEENRIVNKSRKKAVVENVETELDFSRFLLDALKISGTLMSWRGIREKLGLQSSDEPIAEGLYTVVEDGILESIVIQGDVEKIVFSADTPDQRQVIRIIKETIPYEIRYKPGENDLICWDHSIENYVLFKEKILVNGDIFAIEQEGGAAFLGNADIRVFASGKIVIHSGLETKADDPHLDLKKMRLTNLTVSCGKAQLFNRGSAGNEIIVEPANANPTPPAKTEIRVSVITAGKFTNNSPHLGLNGSLYCTDLENNGTIEIDYIPSALTKDGANYFRTVDFTAVYAFFIQFIEEVSDEDR